MSSNTEKKAWAAAARRRMQIMLAITTLSVAASVTMTVYMSEDGLQHMTTTAEAAKSNTFVAQISNGKFF